MKDDCFIQAVEKLRPKMSMQSIMNSPLHFHVLTIIASQVENRLAANITGKNYTVFVKSTVRP